MRLTITDLRPMVLADKRTAIWPRFTATAAHEADDEFARDFAVDMDIEVNRWGRGTCTRVEVRSLDGESVSGALLRRIPLQRFVTQAVAEAGSQFAPTDQAGRFAGLSAPEGAATAVRLIEGGRVPRSGDPITDEHLGQVAEVYREAVAEGDPPLRAVEAEFEAKRATASKWVAKARERGFLPQTTRGRMTA